MAQEGRKNMETIKEEFVTVAEAAEMLGKGMNRVGKLCRAGRFSGAVKMGNSWIIPREAVLNHKPLPPGVKSQKTKLAAEKAEILQQVAEAGGVMVELPEDVQQAMGRADAVEKLRKKSHRKATREE
jgi:hypothetical protein